MKENNPNVKHNHEQLVNPSKEKQSSHILLFPETHICLMIPPPPPRHEHFKEREERRSCDFWHHSRKKQLSPGILVQVHQPVTPQCKSSREESELHPGIGALEHRALLATCLSNSEGSSNSATSEVFLLSYSFWMVSHSSQYWESREKNLRRFSSDKTGKPSPAVRDSRALALRCPCQCCPAQQQGMVMAPTSFTCSPN